MQRYGIFAIFSPSKCGKSTICRKKIAKPLVGFLKSTTFASQFRKRGTHSRIAETKLGYGVIGNTTDSGPVIPGSSPGIPTNSGASRSTLKPRCFVCCDILLPLPHRQKRLNPSPPACGGYPPKHPHHHPHHSHLSHHKSSASPASKSSITRCCALGSFVPSPSTPP